MLQNIELGHIVGLHALVLGSSYFWCSTSHAAVLLVLWWILCGVLTLISTNPFHAEHVENPGNRTDASCEDEEDVPIIPMDQRFARAPLVTNIETVQEVHLSGAPHPKTKGMDASNMYTFESVRTLCESVEYKNWLAKRVRDITNASRKWRTVSLWLHGAAATCAARIVFESIGALGASTFVTYSEALRVTALCFLRLVFIASSLIPPKRPEFHSALFTSFFLLVIFLVGRTVYNDKQAHLPLIVPIVFVGTRVLSFAAHKRHVYYGKKIFPNPKYIEL